MNNELTVQKEQIKIIKKFYRRINCSVVDVEFGIFGKWKDYNVKVIYTKNNVYNFTDLFKTEDVYKMEKP